MIFKSFRMLRSTFSTVREYLLSGIWSVQPESQTRWKSIAIRTFRVLSVAVAEFFKDRCLLRASSLTFYTLMSIVPVFAVIFGIAKGFGLEKLLEKQLTTTPKRGGITGTLKGSILSLATTSADRPYDPCASAIEHICGSAPHPVRPCSRSIPSPRSAAPSTAASAPGAGRTP